MLVVVVLALSGCDDEVPIGPLDSGLWGGVGIALVITEAGADVELDCAAGEVTEPFEPRRDGSFDLAGIFSPGQGGPAREDDPPEILPARYRGTVDGRRMSLEILQVEGEGDPPVIGLFDLERGGTPQLRKCV